MTVDAVGNAYLAGTTSDPSFQLTPGAYNTTPPIPGNDTMFVLKLDITGKLVWSTLVPGNSPRVPGTAYANNFVTEGILVNANGEVTTAGLAGLGLPTTAGVLGPVLSAPQNDIDPTGGFALQLNSAGSKLDFATYITGADQVGALAVDGQGNFYVAGITSETNLPVLPNAYQKSIVPTPTCPACNAGFILKMDGQGKNVLAATYLSGGSGANYRGVAVDSKNNVVVGGFAFGPDFPLKNPIVSTFETSLSFAGAVVGTTNQAVRT
jgi:hypothetical protein